MHSGRTTGSTIVLLPTKFKDAGLPVPGLVDNGRNAWISIDVGSIVTSSLPEPITRDQAESRGEGSLCEMNIG